MASTMHEYATTPTSSVVLKAWAFGCIAGTLVVCSEGKDGPFAEDVDGYIARLAIEDFDKILIHSAGPQMSARDRSRIAAFWRASGRQMPPLALLSDNLVTRTMITAFRWLTGTADVRAFTGSEFVGALQWLRSDAPPAQVVALIGSLHASLRAKQARATSQLHPKIEIDEQR